MSETPACPCRGVLGLIGRTQDDKVEVPWDIVEARLSIAA